MKKQAFEADIAVALQLLQRPDANAIGLVVVKLYSNLEVLMKEVDDLATHMADMKTSVAEAIAKFNDLKSKVVSPADLTSLQQDVVDITAAAAALHAAATDAGGDAGAPTPVTPTP